MPEVYSFIIYLFVLLFTYSFIYLNTNPALSFKSGFEFYACFKIYVQKFKAKSLNQLISKLNNPILKSLNDLNELNQFLLF